MDWKKYLCIHSGWPLRLYVIAMGFSIVGSENVKYVTSQEIIHSESDVKPRTMHILS